MGFTFVPEFYFKSFDLADADFLLSQNIHGIILDVDNTLEPYENPHPTKKVIDWLEDLRAHGINAAIVSNNDANRIDLFNESIGLVTYSKAKKPLKKNVLNAMAAIGTSRENTVLMGDQVFTDVWAAHNAGIRAILVPPIRDKRDLFTRFKRLLEIPILKKYQRKQRKVK